MELRKVKILFEKIANQKDKNDLTRWVFFLSVEKDKTTKKNRKKNCMPLGCKVPRALPNRHTCNSVGQVD